MRKTRNMKRKIIFALSIIILSSCSKSQVKEVIPIKTLRGKTLVTVKIGDVVIPDILLDTGLPFDGIIIYNPDYSDSLDLTHSIDVNIGGAGSGNDSKALMIDSTDFFLGNIKMENQRIIMIQSDIYKGFPSNGIIGYSIFGHYKTMLNYDNNTMTLFDSNKVINETNWTEIPIYFKDNTIPWMNASVIIDKEQPVSLEVYIDFAAGDAVMLLEKSNMKFSLPKETNNVHIGRGLSGDIYGKTGIISKLIIGPFELNNVKASFASAEVRSKQDNADAILGNESLRRFNLIFDYANKKLLLKPNKHFEEPY